MRRILATLLAVISVATFAHEGHLNEAPWAACDNRDIGDACAYENAAEDVYRGTCRSMSEHLICVRNQPIERSAPQQDTATVIDKLGLVRKTG